VRLSDAKVLLVKNGYPDAFKPIDDNSESGKSAEKLFLFLESRKSLTPENINIVVKHLPIVDLLFKKISNEKAPNETINLQHHINSISRSSRKIAQFRARKKAGLHKPFDATVAEIRKQKKIGRLTRKHLSSQAKACLKYCKRLNHVDGMHVLANAIFSKFNSSLTWKYLYRWSKTFYVKLYILRDILYDAKGIYEHDKLSQANDAELVFSSILSEMGTKSGKKTFRDLGAFSLEKSKKNDFPLWENYFEKSEDNRVEQKEVANGKEAMKDADNAKEAQPDITFSHAGGLFHILGLLKGKKGCMDDGFQMVGAYVHPVGTSNEQRPIKHDLDRFYATRASIYFFDFPAAMFGDIDNKHLNAAHNPYEAFITTKNFKNVRKPRIRLVHRTVDPFPCVSLYEVKGTISEELMNIAKKTCIQ